MFSELTKQMSNELSLERAARIGDAKMEAPQWL